jgi:hypothetical protein
VERPHQFYICFFNPLTQAQSFKIDIISNKHLLSPALRYFKNIYTVLQREISLICSYRRENFGIKQIVYPSQIANKSNYLRVIQNYLSSSDFSPAPKILL